MSRKTKQGTAIGIALVVLLSGVMLGQHAFGHKLTATSYSDGYNKGSIDAARDHRGLNGHGYDDSCPSSHTDVYCSGYENGYRNTWNNFSSDNVQTIPVRNHQTQGLGQSSSINVHGDNNDIHVDQSGAQSQKGPSLGRIAVGVLDALSQHPGPYEEDN